MTSVFLDLKEYFQNQINEERASIGPISNLHAYHFALQKVKEIEAKFEVNSLKEAGY